MFSDVWHHLQAIYLQVYGLNIFQFFGFMGGDFYFWVRYYCTNCTVIYWPLELDSSPSPFSFYVTFSHPMILYCTVLHCTVHRPRHFSTNVSFDFPPIAVLIFMWLWTKKGFYRFSPGPGHWPGLDSNRQFCSAAHRQVWHQLYVLYIYWMNTKKNPPKMQTNEDNLHTNSVVCFVRLSSFIFLGHRRMIMFLPLLPPAAPPTPPPWGGRNSFIFSQLSCRIMGFRIFYFSPLQNFFNT